MSTKTVLVLGPRAESLGPMVAAEFSELDVRIRPEIAGADGDIAMAHAIICNGPSFTEDIVGKASQLEFIQAMTTGVDAILACRNLPPDILVASMRGIHGPQMSELTLLHMMALSRQYPRILANQGARHWEQWSSPTLVGRTITILGTGAIAGDLAVRCQAFGMAVHGISGTPRDIPGFDRVFGRDRLLDAVALADFFVILVPLTPSTTRIVDGTVFAAMKRSAFLVNMARGDIVDEPALIEALASQRIAGAALDVFSSEPLAADSPLWALETAILSPRLGGLSDAYVEQALPIVVANLRAWHAGDRKGLVNRIRG